MELWIDVFKGAGDSGAQCSWCEVDYAEGVVVWQRKRMNVCPRCARGIMNALRRGLAECEPVLNVR